MIPGVGEAIGGGMALISGAIQTNQNKKAQERNYRLNEQSADNAQRRAMEMWEATNYDAQRKQMEKAGLNPGLMMSQGGSQPSTQGAQGGTSGGGSGDYNITGGVSTMGLLGQQMELIKAQTNKTNAEAENLRGADRTKTQTETASLLQGINNQKAQQVLTEVQSNIAKLDERIKGDSIEEATNYIRGMREYQVKQIESLGYQNAIDKATVQNKISQVEAELAGSLVRNELAKAQIINTQQSTEESKAKINKMIQDVAQGWQTLNNEGQKIKIDKFAKELQAEYPGLLQVGGGIIDKMVRGIHSILGIEHDQHSKKMN
ncbi:MAG: DNA pilot protein [Microviridae sp.]|nr:MAG: DNA pilot protein [Microviridae sp.]